MEQKPNFSIANIVVSTEINATLDINSFFAYLPIKKEKSITNISRNEHKLQLKSKREIKRVKFIGSNECFVSVRYNEKARGIRLYAKKRNITAFADADLQMFDKNFHMKVSKNKINLMGVQNFEHINSIFSFMTTTFNTMQKSIKRKKDPNLLYRLTAGESELCYKTPTINNVLINFNILDSMFDGDSSVFEKKTIVLKNLTSDLHAYKEAHQLDYSLHFHNENGKHIQMMYVDSETKKKYTFTIKPNCKVNLTTNGDLADITAKYVEVKQILRNVLFKD